MVIKALSPLKVLVFSVLVSPWWPKLACQAPEHNHVGKLLVEGLVPPMEIYQLIKQLWTLE